MWILIMLHFAVISGTLLGSSQSLSESIHRASQVALPLPWECEISEALLQVHSNYSYTLSVHAKPWLEDGDYAVHWDGLFYSLRAGTLHVAHVVSSNAIHPLLGKESNLTLTWDGDPYLFQTIFSCYSDADVFLFSTEFPEAVGPGLSTPTATDPDMYNFNVSVAPVTHFPSWKLGNTATVSSLGHVEWAGEFCFHHNNMGVSLAGYVGGQTGGPVLLHEPTWATGSKPQAAMIGASDGFKSNILAIVPDPVIDGQWRWVFGPHGHFDSLPAGFSSPLAVVVPSGNGTHQTCVYAQDTGLTAAIYAYGAFLRLLHNTTRFAPEQDRGVVALSFWSDNGQIYMGDHWHMPGMAGTGGQTYTGLKAWWAENNLPVQSVQLDPFWFCETENGTQFWRPCPFVFGDSGWAEMQVVNIRLTLYTFFWNPNNEFVNDFRFVISHIPSGHIARIAPEDSLRFHELLFARCKSWSCIGFEIDFLDYNYLAFPDGLQVPGTFEAMMTGLSSAAVLAGIPVQLCMPLPSDILLSTQLPGVSNIRASDDNDLTYASADRWRIGLTSLLLGAMDIRPFFDGTWTHPFYEGNDSTGVPFPSGYVQNATELGVIVSVLSTGPVGLGDKLGFTNITLARVACASNGVLLKPSLPAGPVDLYFRYPSALQQTQAEVWQAPSYVPVTYGNVHAIAARLRARQPENGLEWLLNPALATKSMRSSIPNASNVRPSTPRMSQFPAVTPCPFVTVLVVDVPETAALVLQPGDLTPSLDVSAPAASVCGAAAIATGYVAVPWSAGLQGIAARCRNNAPATGCVLPFDAHSVLEVATGQASNREAKGALHPFELYSLAPLLPNGWALLGELDKAIRVAPVRVAAVVYTQDSMVFWVNGAAKESISMAVLAPAGASTNPDSRPVGNNHTEEGTPPAYAVVNSSVIITVNVTFPETGGSAQVTCISANATTASACEVTVM